jgi:hypothetical protein
MNLRKGNVEDRVVMVEKERLRSGEAKGVKDEERVEENTMTNFRVFLAGEVCAPPSFGFN